LGETHEIDACGYLGTKSLGCGLRRGELLALTMNSVQLREEHWVIADLIGKGGHLRTVPIPNWVKIAMDSWTVSGGIGNRPGVRDPRKE
jgi:site-specific recombinase XerC